jgi:phosphoesterase RecJ-like protein
MTFTASKIKELKAQLKQARSIVITAHKSPDADSVGSSIGLRLFLEKLGYVVTVCHPDKAPSFLWWMPGHDKLLNYDDQPKECENAVKGAGLIFCLDYNSANRLGKLEKVVSESNAFTVMIDHHQDPDKKFCKLMFSNTKASSTSELIYELIEALGSTPVVDKNMAAALYAGIMMDTGSFRFSSTTKRTHEIAGRLISTGLKHWEIHERIHDTNSPDRLKLTGYALLERLVVMADVRSAYIWLDQADLERFKADKGATEGLVNIALSIQGIKVAALLKEEAGIIKMSFRSKGSIPVNLLANDHFEGGGHINAAGGKVVGKMKTAIQKFEKEITAFYDKHIARFKELE